LPRTGGAKQRTASNFAKTVKEGQAITAKQATSRLSIV